MGATRTLLAVAGLGALGYGLYRYFKKQTDLLMQYEITPSAVRFKKLTTSLVVMEIVTRFRSKSDIEATVERVYGDVIVNGVNVGYFNEVKPFVVPARGESDVPITFSFSPERLVKNFMLFVTQAINTKDLPIQIKGYVTVRSGLLKLNVPYEYETTVKSYISG